MKDLNKESVTIQIMPQTKDKLIALCGERGLGRAVDMLVKLDGQQPVQSTILGRLDSISRAQDLIMDLLKRRN